MNPVWKKWNMPASSLKLYNYIMKYIFYLTLIAIVFFGCKSATELTVLKSIPEKQINIKRVELMPNLPQPYSMKDWRQTAIGFDNYVYDWKSKGEYRPFIWADNAARNNQGKSFGLYTAIGDVREGPEINNGENHEAIGALGSIIGATMVGIDKSNQAGFNYVAMIKNYFNTANGFNIIMNFTNPGAHIGGGYGNDYWYDIFNNVLFYGVANFYPKEDAFPEIQKTIADQFLRSAVALNYNFTASFFDFKQMKAGINHIPTQEDVAAGYAFILYAAYVKFHDTKYLEAAMKSLEALQNQKENRYYEILMPFGAYLAARFNAEQGKNFDITKFLDWSFDGNPTNREGWGVIVGKWGDYDVSGLAGSTTHQGGYGFAMNTFDMAWPLFPLVRYDQRYARAIGKWAVNAANAARLYYPLDIPDKFQALPHKKEITKNVIAYEGLIKESNYDKYKGVTPFAQGDGPQWAPNMPEETMFSIYGSGHVGFFGGTITTTDVKGILVLDCNKSDMYTLGKSFPTRLVYNPYKESKTITFDVGSASVNIYNTVTHSIIAKNIRGKTSINLAADQAAVLVLIPAQVKLKIIGNQLIGDRAIIDYRM